MCDGKWIVYNNWQQPAQWMDQKEAPKHFPKSDLHQNRSLSPFAVGLIHYS